MSEWQAVTDRSPKRGRLVLATWAKTWEEGRPHIEVCVRDGRWFYAFDGDAPDMDDPPTHFKSLPAPPEPA